MLCRSFCDGTPMIQCLGGRRGLMIEDYWLEKLEFKMREAEDGDIVMMRIVCLEVLARAGLAGA
jgi:hypothetical protein